MKNISSFLTEMAGEWKCEAAPFNWKANAEYISINENEYIYGFVTEQDIANWEREFSEDPKVIKTVLNLKPGECFSPDGSNYFIRIKK